MNCDKIPISDNLVIFSQAPADVQYVLSLYEEYSQQCRIIIVVMGIRSNYDFLKSLSLKNVDLHFIDVSVHRLKIFNLWTVKRKLYRFYQNLMRAGDLTIYFFSYYFDYYTFYLVARLAKSHYCILINIYGTEREPLRHLRLLERIKLAFLRTLFCVRLRYAKAAVGPVVTFQFREHGIEAVQMDLDPQVLTRHLYRVPGSDSRSVLFFESGPPPGSDSKHYGEVVDRVVSRLRNMGWQVYIKPHPRLGHSYELASLGVIVLPSHIPGELIEARRFDFVLGVYSSAIAMLARNQGVAVVSIGPMMEFWDTAAAIYLRSYLVELANGGLLLFAGDMDEFQSYVERFSTCLIGDRKVLHEGG